MKRSLLAAALAVSFISGCVSTSAPTFDDLKSTGSELASTEYKASSVSDVEKIRQIVNRTFIAAKPVYENYVDTLLAESDVSNYVSAVRNAESEEEAAKLYESLTPEQKQKVDRVINSEQMKEIFLSLGKLALETNQITDVFGSMDKTSFLTELDFSNLVTEKDNLSFTMSQLDYLNDTIASAYKNHQIMARFSSSI